MICHVGLCLEDPAGGPKQTWKEIAALAAPHRAFKTLSASSYLLDLTKQPLFFLCVRHIKTACLKRRCRLKSSNDWEFHAAKLCFSCIFWVRTQCKMLQLGDNKSCTPWMSTHQLLWLNRIIHLFGDGCLSVIAYTAPIIDADWQLFQMHISQLILASFPSQRQDTSLPDVARIWIKHKWTIGNDHNCCNPGSFSNSHKGSIEIQTINEQAQSPAVDCIDLYWVYSVMQHFCNLNFFLSCTAIYRWLQRCPVLFLKWCCRYSRT